MGQDKTDALVSTEWLAEHLDAPDVRVIDATWFPPGVARNPRAEYEKAHIPGAVFFDVDELCDTASPLPHMLPPPEKFSSAVRKMGLGDGNHLVVYDQGGAGCAAARAWWMFRVFGHKEVSVLDGGLGKWLREGRPTEDVFPMPRRRHFTARIDTTLVRDLAQMQNNLESAREQVVDARAAARFRGESPEPRPVKRLGHIPGSLNLPYDGLYDPKTGVMRPANALKELFKAAGVDLSRPTVTTCGSGVTACALALGLYVAGRTDAAVYDGSWAEWGNRDDCPVET